MGDILESKQFGDEEKAKLYNQVLQRYLTYYDQRKGQPLHVKLTTPKTTETPKPVENAESTEEASPDNSLPTAVEQEVMKSVPKIYKAGARQLLDKIKKHQDVLHWNDKGELLYENKPIPNLVPRVLSYPPYRARERERTWKTLVTLLRNKINSEGGVLCLTLFCLVYSQHSRSDRNSKIDLLTLLQLQLKLRKISA